MKNWQALKITEEASEKAQAMLTNRSLTRDQADVAIRYASLAKRHMRHWEFRETDFNAVLRHSVERGVINDTKLAMLRM